MLRIKRNTGFMGAGSRIRVSVNDEKAALVKQNQQIELELPANEAKIAVSQFGIYSNELMVKKVKLLK